MRHSKSLVGPGTVMQELEARRLLDAAPTDVGDPPTALWTGGSGVVLEQQRTADLNGDGYADVVAVQRRRLLTFLNRGDGTFGEPTVTRLAGFVGKIGVGRFDGSGSVGVASAGTWPRPGQGPLQVLRLLRFDVASGGFEVVDRKVIGIGAVAEVEAANVADDARDEIVVLGRVGNGSTSVLTVRVTTAGSLFSVRTTTELVGPGAAQLLVRGSVTAITFSNVSGDGRVEMIVGSLSDGLAVVRVYSAAAPRQADAIRFRSSVPFASGSNVVRSLSAADVTGDGRVDLVLGLGRMGDEGLPLAASEIVARTGLAVVPREDGGWGRAVDTGVDFGAELVASQGLIFGEVVADSLAVVALGDLDGAGGIEALVVRRTAYVVTDQIARTLTRTESTAVFRVGVATGGWTSRLAWRQSWATGNDFRPGGRFGTQPPAITGLAALGGAGSPASVLGWIAGSVAESPLIPARVVVIGPLSQLLAP